jgi:hypothetical protein
LQDWENLLSYQQRDCHLCHRQDLCPNLVAHPPPQWSQQLGGGWAIVVVEAALVAWEAMEAVDGIKVVGVFF